ncbi:MAG: DUF4160 domain-containing protein [Bacteroidota bacterium]|nr:DUF4160 domain-containing protein [Bacteroidota bacterium]
MPTILRIYAFRFHFYSDEGNEPPHVHVDCGEGECKFWLNPIKLADVYNVSSIKIREIEKIIYENRELLIDKYVAFHK